MKVKILGEAELKKKFNELSKVTQQRYLRTAVLAGLLPVQNEAVRLVKKVSGNLARSIHSEIVLDQENYVEGYTGTDVEYARRIEFGFDDMTDSLGRTYHQKPQPYMRPAYDTKKQEAVDEIADIMRVLIMQIT